MIRIFTLSFMLFALNVFSQTDTANAIYDFNNLAVGNLHLQNGWITTKYSTTTDITVAATGSFDGSKSLYFSQTGPNVGVDASRGIDTIFANSGFSDYASTYVITIDMVKSYWGVDFSIGADLNNDGKVTKNDATEQVFKFTGSTVNGEKIMLPNGTVYTLTNALTGAWSTVEITLSNFRTSTSGKINVRTKPLGSTTWMSVLTNTDFGIDTVLASKKNPSLWDMVFFHIEGGTGKVDNISFKKITPVATGIEESINNSALNVYPNPFDNKLTIENGEVLKGETTINIRSVTGSLVYTAPMSAEMKQEIEINSLLPGVYFLEVKNAKGNYYRKLVKK